MWGTWLMGRRRGTAGAPGARSRRSRQAGRAAVTALGVLLVWGSLGFTGYAAGWTLHKDHAQSVLLRQATAHGDRSATATPQPCVQAQPATGQLAGVVSIPTIGLRAPVEQGTGDTQLAVAVGHVPASVWPGEAGTSVLLGHDVSYFVHLDALHPGDLVQYQDRCSTVEYRVTGSHVVPAGSPIDNSSGPTLVLDTCWPTNALFYTSQRLLVDAVEVSGGQGGRRGPTGPTPTAAPPTYSVPAPPALVAQGLTLQQNEEPMGTLTLTGSPSMSWEESPGPLALTASALEAFFGGVHATGSDRADWWSAVAPGVAMPGPLVGATVSRHDAPLDVSIDSADGVPDAVTLTTDVTVSGGAAPGPYHEVVTEDVNSGVVTVHTWQMTWR